MPKNEDITKLPETESRNRIRQKVKIPGTNIEAEIRPESECLSEDIMRLATPKDLYDSVLLKNPEIKHVDGTKGGYHCRVCDCEIVLAPSGQRLEAQGGKFTCARCVIRVMQDQIKGGN